MERLELDFRFVVAAARRSIRLHLADLNPELGSTGYVRAPALVARLTAELKLYDSEIADRAVKFIDGDETSQVVYTTYVRTRANELARLEAPVAWCRDLNEFDTSLAQVYFAQEAASAIVGGPCEVVAVPSADTGFATPVPIKVWEAQIAPVTPEPVVVFVPPQEMRTSALLPLLAHEVAHTAVSTHHLLSIIKTSAGDSWKEAVDEAASSAVIQSGTARNAALIYAEAKLERWVVELMCDALATCYCGSSYLFAFCGAVLGRELDGPNNSHPPASERVNSILALLKLMGHDLLEFDPGTTEADRPSYVATWLLYVANARLTLDDTNERLLRACTAMQKLIHQVARGQLGAESFGAPQLRDEAAVVDLLRHRIVVAQLASRHVDRRTILHAAWSLMFSPPETGRGLPPEAMITAMDDVEYQDVLDRSVELSYVVERWNTSGVGSA